MITQLPKWALVNKFPALYDTESLTVVEQTARLYGKINELIESYNNYIELVNSEIKKFTEATDANYEEFSTKIIKITEDFITTIDMNIVNFSRLMDENFTAQNKEISERLAAQDNEIAAIYNTFRNDVINTVSSILAEMKESGELGDTILTSLTTVENAVVNLTAQLETVETEIENLETRLNDFEVTAGRGISGAESAANQAIIDAENAANQATANAAAIQQITDGISIINMSQQGLNDKIDNIDTANAADHAAIEETLAIHDNTINQYAGDISVLKTGTTLYDGALEYGESMSVPVLGIGKYNLVLLQTTMLDTAVCYVRKAADHFYISGTICMNADSVNGAQFMCVDIAGVILEGGEDGKITKNTSVTFTAYPAASCNISNSGAQIRRIIGLI